MTLVGISGDSAQDLTDPTKPIIYAGFTSGCPGDGVSTCDSCTGELNSGSKLWPCNKKNAYPNLPLTIRVSTTTVGANASNAVIKIGDEKYEPTATPTFADGILTVTMTWGEICNSPNVNKTNQCSESFTADLAIGFEVAGTGTSTTDSMTFKIRAKVAKSDNSDWFYTDCRTTSTANTGACYFTVFPGDEKIYADNFSVAEGYPNTNSTGIEYTNVVFFYEQQTGGEDDNTLIARIGNNSAMASLGVNRAASPPLADTRITGLANGARYCMIMANQDASGIISYFTPPPGTSGSPVTVAEICTSPSPVVGLLDDKSCFIATAAFGSDMAAEVQSFRDFRNKFLIPYSWGRAFVKFYYKHSPFYANLIAESEVAKAVVRAALWPLLLFARVTVSVGLWASLAILAFLMISSYVLYSHLIIGKRFHRKPANFRGEL